VSGTVETTLGLVRYRIAGKGLPVILLPQAGRTSRLFTRLLPCLSARCRAITLDLPGFGMPLATDQPGIGDLARALIEAMTALAIPAAHVYGLHTGNKIAAAAGCRAPERFSGIILAGQSHSLIPDRAARNAAIYKVIGGRFGDMAATDLAGRKAGEWAAAFQTLAKIWWNRDLVTGGFGPAARAAAEAEALDLIETLAATPAVYAANFAFDLQEAYRALRCRTLILEITTPLEDRVIGRQGETVQRMIADSSLARIHDQRDGIVTMEDRPQDLADVILGLVGDFDGH
jgi:pimeloyl-ACP methyl ester carboxylesterase